MLQIPQVGRYRATESLATVSSVPVFLCIDKESIAECLPVPLSLDDLRSRQQFSEASVAAAASKGTPRFQLFLKKGRKTNLLVVEPGMKLRHAVAADVIEDQ